MSSSATGCNSSVTEELGHKQSQKERRQEEPQIWLTVRDDAGNVIRRLKGVNKKGFHRIAWDLRYPATDAVSSVDDMNGNFIGAMVAPGTYTVELAKQVDGQLTKLSQPMPFIVERAFDGALPITDPKETAAFWRETERLNRSITAATKVLEKTLQRVKLLKNLLMRTPSAPGNMDKELHNLEQSLLALDERLNGNRSKREVGEKTMPTIAQRKNVASSGTFNSSYGPTPTQRRSLEIAATEFSELKNELELLVNQELPRIEKTISDTGAPWIEGQKIPDY